MRRRWIGFLFLLAVVAISGCISTSSEPEINQVDIVQANTPNPPTSTANDIQIPDEPSEASAIVATEEPTDNLPPDATTTPREVPAQFDIVGIIRNATTNTILADPLDVNAIFLTQDGESTIELYNDTITADEDGTFRFESIATDSGIVNLRVTYAGIRQYSNLYLLPADLNDEGVLEIDLFVYEITSDRSGLSYNYVETYFDASPSENAASVLQNVEIINMDNEIVFDGQYSFRLSLPPNAINPRIQVPPILGLLPEDLAVLEETDQGAVFLGVVPILPGPTGRLFFSVIYDLRYDEEVTVTQQFDYPVSQMTFWVVPERELRIESDRLATEPDQVREDINYVGYSITEPITANDNFTYRIAGGVILDSDVAEPTPAAATTITQTTDTNPSDTGYIVVGIGILLIVAGVLYMIYDVQRTRITMKEDSAPNVRTASEKDLLLEEVAALDEAYERGEIAEAAYQQRRQDLKNRLRRFFE